jgi:hypothetical protein
LFGPIAGLQSPETGSRLVELALQRFQPRLKFILPQLRDDFTLGDRLTLSNGQLNEQSGDLESQLNLLRGFHFSREGAHMRLTPRGHNDRFHGTNNFGCGRSGRRTPSHDLDEEQGNRDVSSDAPGKAELGIHDCLTSSRKVGSRAIAAPSPKEGLPGYFLFMNKNRRLLDQPRH